MPFTLNSCSSVMTYDSVKSWVSTNYIGDDSYPRAAIATFSWDYHGTTGPKAIEEVKRLMNDYLPTIIPEFKDVIYYPDGVTIGQRIVVYHTLWITPLTNKNFGTTYYKEEDCKKTTFRIHNNELSATDSLVVNGVESEETKYNSTIVHVHNRHGYYRGIGFKIGRGFIDKENIIKLKVIIDLTYEDN